MLEEESFNNPHMVNDCFYPLLNTHINIQLTYKEHVHIYSLRDQSRYNEHLWVWYNILLRMLVFYDILLLCRHGEKRFVPQRKAISA